MTAAPQRAWRVCGSAFLPSSLSLLKFALRLGYKGRLAPEEENNKMNFGF